MLQLQPYIMGMFFALCIFAEGLHTYHNDRPCYTVRDSFARLYIGATYVLSNFLGKYLLLRIFQAAHHYHICSFGFGWLSWIALFFLNDLIYYCFHRAEHRVNWFWLSHAVHHSSNHFNVLTAVRLPWTGQLSGQFLFWIWLPAVGFDPAMVIFMYNMSVLYQAWLHTESIDRLPRPIEFIFNTPSHHRVHHARNKAYLDRNFGAVLIIWDRLFGTFYPETEKPVYGLAKEDVPDNPLRITIMEWRRCCTAIRRTAGLRNIIKYLTRPPGWQQSTSDCLRPKDLQGQNEIYSCMTESR